MHASHIQLLEDDLIDPNKFLDLIVDLTCPSRESASGIGSVIGKKGSDPTSGTPLPFTFELTDSDRATLENLLPLLPDLHGNMSEGEIARFLESYRQLDDRPTWEPSIVIEKSRMHRKEQRIHLKEDHRLALSNAVASGEVKAVQSNYLPVKFLSIGTFIPRNEAIEYMQRRGIGLDYIAPSKQAIRTTQPLEQGDAFPEKALVSLDAEKHPSAEQASESKTLLGTVKRWTPEKLAELAEYRRKNGSKKAAEYFKISEGRIRQLLPGESKKQSVTPIWGQLQNKR